MQFLNVIASGITLGYELDDWGFVSRQGLGIFLFTTESRPALGPIQPPIQWVPGTLSLGLKRPGCEADHLSPSIAEVKNARKYTSTPPYVFMAWCLIKHSGKVILTLLSDACVHLCIKTGGTLRRESRVTPVCEEKTHAH
jgi:hypothetical protein